MAEESKLVEHHDIDQVWDSIKGLQAGQEKNASSTSELSGQMAVMTGALNRLDRTVSNIQNKPHKEFDWKGLATVALGIMGMSAALIASTISPIHRTVAKHDGQIMRELEESAIHRYKAGIRDGKLEALESVSTEMFTDLHGRMLELEKQGSYCKANIENNRRWLEAVDFRGSRKHVVSAADAIRKP